MNWKIFSAPLHSLEKLKLYNAITYNDLPLFFRENIQKLKAGNIPDAVMKPRLQDLLDIRKVLTAKEM